MLGTKKTYSIIEIAKMFNTKIKYLPNRPGERFGSTISNNNAKKILGYTAKNDIKDYIKNIVNKNNNVFYTIPTFNNLEYLKICINSINKNSKFNHQIIVHVNEGLDGTIDYLNKNNIEYTFSRENIGMPKALNRASKLSKMDYIVISHDDFYFVQIGTQNFLKRLN